MGQLLYFLYRFRVFFLFATLEILSIWLIVSNNRYHNARFFNSSNMVVASIFNFMHEIENYFALTEINQQIAKENAYLKEELHRRNQSIYSLKVREIDDPDLVNQFSYINAEVINNSIYRSKNHITINKGAKEGIKVNMAVIGSVGAVGKVKSVSAHYALVVSLLNTDVYVSGVIKSTKNFGTVRWQGGEPEYTYLDFIPRHASPSVGDTVITSGFNAIFPKEIPIGIIGNVELSEEASFYKLKVRLTEDFTKLTFVKVIENHLKAEKDSLEQVVVAQP